MNRLQFFKWIGKGAVVVAVAPLAKYLLEAAPTPVLPQIQSGAKFFCISTPRSKSNWFYEAVKNGRVSAPIPESTRGRTIDGFIFNCNGSYPAPTTWRSFDESE